MKVGLNLYSYVLNNPTNLVDPLGLFPNATEAQAMAAMQNPQNQTCAQAASTAYNWNNSMNPIFRGMFGVGQIGYGSFQMSSGASVLTGGTTATATIPLVGQILGPAAAIYGGMQVCSGANNARKGANNLWDALNGNGFSSLNLPMPQMPQQP